jgi:cold shock CspA family protein
MQLGSFTICRDAKRMLELPSALVEEARRGRLVLLLGAGASYGAVASDGRKPLTGNGLRDALADRFLGGKCKDAPLAWVAELAISETDLGAVQDFIADLLRDMQPAAFQLKLPTFRWRGIATTNYDTIVEAAYRVKDRIQDLIPIRSDNDKIDELLRSRKDLALLKLHGCITRTRDPLIPFILTVEQYVTHRRGRAQLFATLEEWGREFPIVFVGHAGQDPDLRELLLELSRVAEFRPRYYFLKPDVDATERRLWESKRVGVIEGTFEQFINALDCSIDASLRPILKAVDGSHPIQRHFAVDEHVSALLIDYLTSDLEYVNASLPVSSGNPKDFYRGFDFGWYPIVNQLDVRRELTDRVLNDIVIRAEADRPSVAELYAIVAEAGAGKSVFLRRLAWEAATDADVLCLYLREDGVLRYEALREIYRVTQQRLFLYIDSAARHTQEIVYAVTNAVRERLPLTIFTTERHNVWNMSCEHLLPILTEMLTLRYLSNAEIRVLVDLLAKHESLGPHLTGKNREECVKEFEERAGRQLLVALHEATVGLPFEEILLHEYEQIEPHAAQQLYLTVCVMNRLKVGVRAGLIARVHGIQFEEFRVKLFSPLEHVVQVRQHPGTQDYLYAARHPEIAQIVFDHVLDKSVDRFNEYVRIISQLNLGYSPDRSAFRGLLRAKALHDLFPNFQDVKAIFAAAERVAPREAYLYHQQANYERIRPNGNLDYAERLLQSARDLDPRDSTIVHTLAELKRTRAERASHDLERERFRNEARALLGPLLADNEHGGYARVTLVRIAIDDLRDVLLRSNSSDKEVDQAIRSVEANLERAQQQFPDEPFLLAAEAEFGGLLRDSDRSYSALQRAFEANARDPYIASRLARLQEEKGDLVQAEAVLTRALDGNRGDKQLNFQYANVLRRAGSASKDQLIYHYRRAFTKWDTNHEAQFLFARYAFESDDDNDRTESKEAFRHLREVPLAHDVRVQIRDVIGGEISPRSYYGRLIRREYGHGFIERDGVGDWIFCHKRFVNDWDNLAQNERVQFAVGFSFAGAIALNVSKS